MNKSIVIPVSMINLYDYDYMTYKLCMLLNIL